mgnify:CR=1 FL=1
MGTMHNNDMTGASPWQRYASGIADSPFEGISPLFTDMSVVCTSAHHVLVRARRYGRWFLLKGLTSETRGNAAFQGMLRKELQILMRLQHPNVVQAVGFEDVDKLGPCIIMEWIEGDTLDDWLQGTGERPGTEPQGTADARNRRRRLAMELLQAVAYVHQMGVVHRDLKPQNVMVTRNGQSIKLIDFSLADSDGDAVLKQPAGTPAYMSAEQRQSDVPDVRNDIYSLGLVLDQMGLGHRFAPLVRRCQLPIDRRYHDMSELLAHFQRLARRRKWGSVAAAVAVSATVGASVMTLLMAWQSQGAATTTEPNVAGTEQEIAAKSDSVISLLMHELEQKDSQIVSIKQLLEEQSATMTTADVNAQMRHAIEVGKRKVDERIAYWNVDVLLDTLTRWEYRHRDLQTRIDNVGKDTYDYFDNIENMFSEQEMQQIRTAVLDYWSAWNERTMRRIEMLPDQK